MPKVKWSVDHLVVAATMSSKDLISLGPDRRSKRERVCFDKGIIVMATTASLRPLTLTGWYVH